MRSEYFGAIPSISSVSYCSHAFFFKDKVDSVAAVQIFHFSLNYFNEFNLKLPHISAKINVFGFYFNNCLILENTRILEGLSRLKSLF